MKHVRVAGLAHSDFERFAGALSPMRLEQLELFSGSLYAALRGRPSADAAGRLLLLAYGPPEFAVAHAIRRGDNVGSVLAEWKRDVSDALSALNADPDGVWLVHGLAALSAPARATEALHLSLGVELFIESTEPWPENMLPYLDAARRIASEDDTVVRLYEDLEASSIIASGYSAAEVDSEQLNAAVFSHAEQRELDLKLVEGVVRRLKSIGDGNSAQNLRRQVNALRIKGCSPMAVGVKSAAAFVLTEMVALRDALKEAEEAAAETVSGQAGGEDQEQYALREAAVVAKAFEVAAENVSAAEREVEMLRKATRLAIEDAASRHGSVPYCAQDRSLPVPERRPARSLRGVARWIWLARAYVALRRSELFDSDWYLAQYPDAAGGDSTRHYLLHGGLEGRSPSQAFCSATYLNHYPDVREAGINPLAHYLLQGRSEGRYMFPALLEAKV